MGRSLRIVKKVARGDCAHLKEKAMGKLKAFRKSFKQALHSKKAGPASWAPHKTPNPPTRDAALLPQEDEDRSAPLHEFSLGRDKDRVPRPHTESQDLTFPARHTKEDGSVLDGHREKCDYFEEPGPHGDEKLANVS